MGQIVAINAKPRRANLQAIQTGGSLANEVLQSGEYILIDSTNGKAGEGYGRYDSYIVGDGVTACKNLVVTLIDDIPQITTDAIPTSGSVNPVQSGGVYTALQNVHIDVDSELSATSENPLQNKATKSALDTKQDALVSGVNIKTINSTSLLGNGNIDVSTDISGKADKATTLAGYGITDSYTKTEVDNLIIPADYEVEIVSSLPASGTANTIYRLTGNSSYSDYGWDGTQFVKLAQYDNGIDNTPSYNSENLVKSGGVFDSVASLINKPFTNNKYKFRSSADYTITEQTATYTAGIKLEVQPGDKILLTATGQWDYSTWCFATSDKKTITYSATATTACNNTLLTAPENAVYFYANTISTVTGSCSVIHYRIDELEKKSTSIDTRVVQLENEESENEQFKDNITTILANTLPTIPEKDDIINLNTDKESMLYALGWYGSKKNLSYDSSSYGKRTKRLTLAWITDVHGDEERFKRFLEYCNYYSDVIDAAIATGDMNSEADIDNGWMLTVGKYASKFKMPFLPVVGNHDMAGDIIQSGNTHGNVLSSGSYTRFDTYRFAPFVPADAVKGTGSYYYIDFTTPKIRLIVLNEYELPIVVSCIGFTKLTSEEQAGVEGGTLDYTNAQFNHHYATGTILHYKGLFFKTTSTFGDTSSNLFNDVYGTGKQNVTPCSQYSLWGKYFSQTQIDWLINTLQSVPSGYSVVVASHGPIDFKDTTPLDENWQTSNLATGVQFAQNGFVLQDILSAYNTKGSLTQTYRAISPNTNPLAASPTYINNNDNEYPDVTVNADFSSSNGKAFCYMHGHWHADMIFKSGAMSDDAEIINIGNTCGTMTGGWDLGDLNRGGLKTQDAFNIISFDTYSKTIQLLRVGADMNDQMKHRIFTQLNYN